MHFWNPDFSADDWFAIELLGFMMLSTHPAERMISKINGMTAFASMKEVYPNIFLNMDIMDGP
jgi:hypothetical protein